MKLKRKFFVIALAFMMVFSMLPMQGFASDSVPTLFICRSETDFIKDNSNLSIDKYNGSITLGATSQFGNKQIESVYLVTIQASAKLSIHTKSIWDEEIGDFKVDNNITSTFNTPLNTANSISLPNDDGETIDPPKEINAANFSNYIVTVSELEAAGISFESNSTLDRTSEYYFFAISNTNCQEAEFSAAKLYGVLIQKKVSTEGVDKNALQAEIAKVTGENAEQYPHKSGDRYNGNDVSKVGFWNEMIPALTKAQEVDKRQSATKSEVAEATQELAAAISKLIPSTQANTTKLYEALQDLLTENAGYTAVSWDNYVTAKETAQTLFDGLFREKEGKRVATENNKAEKQGDIDNAAKVLTAAKEDLLQSKGLEERIALWKEASTWLLAQNQQVQQGKYTEASADAWNTAYASLQKAKQEGYQTQSRYNAYTSSVVALSTAYYNLQDSNTEDITVHVRVTDNFGAMFPEYAIQDAATATFDQHVTLGSGNKTISALLSAMDYNDTPKEKTPSNGEQYGEGWKNPEVMVYINGTLAVNRSEYIDSWQGYIGKTEDGKLNTSRLYFDVQLHDKDEIVILRALGPGYNYYGDISAGVADYNFYYGSLALLNIKENVIEVEAGKTFTVNVEKTTAAAEAKKATTNASDVSLFLSEKQETEDAAKAAPALEAVGSKTDIDGKATATLYKEGWYRLGAVNVTPQTPTIGNNNGEMSGGKFPNLAAGDYVLVHVVPSTDTATVRKTLQAELDEVYRAYAEGFYGEDAEAVKTLYNKASKAIASAELLGDAYDAKENAIARMQQLQKTHKIANDRTVEQMLWYLDRLPSQEEVAKGGFTKANRQRFENLKEVYDKATSYQKKLLDGQQSTQYEALRKAYGENGESLPAQRLATVKVTIEGDASATKTYPLQCSHSYERKEKMYYNEQGQQMITRNSEYGTFGPSGYTGQARILGTFDSESFKMLEGSDYYVFDLYTSLKGNISNIVGQPVSKLGYEIYKIEVDGAEVRNSSISKSVPRSTAIEPIFDKDGKYVSGLWRLATVSIANTPANDIHIKVYVRSSDTVKSLAEYQTIAKEALDTKYQSYQKAGYTTDGWAALAKAYQDGLNSIDKITDEANAKTLVENAKQAALTAMAAVKTRAQEQQSSTPGETTGKLGSVTVTISNTTLSGKDVDGKDVPASMQGTFIAETMPLNENTTMMSVILDALERKGYRWEGTGGATATGKDITYIAAITNPEGYRMAEFTGGPESGWMGTLNDWFVNLGFNNFDAKDGKLVDGDVIAVQYTCNLGKDIGSDWGNPDTSLSAMSVSGGKLTPNFTKSQKSYTLVKSGSSVNVSATAYNKNYQVRMYLNSKTGSNYYRSGESIPVKAGDTIYVGVGGKGWPSMNSNAGYQIRFNETWYEIKVVDSASGKEVAKLIDDIGKISYSNYKSKVDTVQTARNGYDALTAEAKKEVKNYSTLQEAEKSLTFYQQIDDAKAKLAALPKLTNPTQAQANAYRSQINEATAAYKKLSAEQQKYITKADVENYNALAKALGVSTIVGADAAPESPVETTGKTGSATTTSPTEVKVSGTTAAATVKAENQSEILKQAAEKKSAEIILEVSKADSKGAENVQMQLETSFVKNISDKTNASLTLDTANGRVSFDQEALKVIISEAKGATITLEVTKVSKPTEAQKKAAGTNGDIFSLLVKSGDKIISEFNKGKATVRVEIPAKLADKKVAAIYIADDAKIEQLAGKVLTIGGKKFYEFTTPHFSTFALVDAEELGLEVEEPQVDAKALTAKLTPVARSAKTAKKNVKVTVSLDKQDKAIIKELKDAGYTVKYRFYRSTKKAASYKSTVTKKTASYTNTSGKKGTKYFYKVQARAYDENGKLIAKTALKQCKYASRTWTKVK